MDEDSQRCRPEFELVGIDFGPNIEWCRANWESGTSIEHDLDSSETLSQKVDVTKAVVVCADVVEHVPQTRRTDAGSLAPPWSAAPLQWSSQLLNGISPTDLVEPGPPLNPAHLSGSGQ